MKKKISLIMMTALFLFMGTIKVSALENTKTVYNGMLRAYIYIAPGGGEWESSGRYNGSYGVTQLGLESNVPGSGYWREYGGSSYVEDGGSRAAWRTGGYARVYAYNGGSTVAGVATSIY